MQSIPLAVLKPFLLALPLQIQHCMQSIPLAVLKLLYNAIIPKHKENCMQSIPLAVLKRKSFSVLRSIDYTLHAIHTACGIETVSLLNGKAQQNDCMQSIPLAVLKPTLAASIGVYLLIACNPYRLRY